MAALSTLIAPVTSKDPRSLSGCRCAALRRRQKSSDGDRSVNKLESGPSPSGRGTREAPREGRKSIQIWRPSPCPLPEGEGESSAIRIFHSTIGHRYSQGRNPKTI